MSKPEQPTEHPASNPPRRSEPALMLVPVYGWFQAQPLYYEICQATAN